MIRLLFLLFLLPGLLPLQAAAAEAAPAGISPALTARLEQTAGGVKTLASDFVQEKHLKMFKTVVSSRGRFFFRKPDQLRWELTEPVASGFVVKGGKGRRWHERTGRTETFDLAREPVMKLVSDQLFAWARADFGWLQKEFRITVLDETPATLRLEPRAAAAAGFLRHLQITFSADGAYVRTVEVHEKDGDFTRIRFVNTVVNKPLQADLF